MPKVTTRHINARAAPYTSPNTKATRTPLRDSTRHNVPAPVALPKTHMKEVPALLTVIPAGGTIVLRKAPQFNDRDESIPLPSFHPSRTQVLEVKYPLDDTLAIIRVQAPASYTLPLTQIQLNHLQLDLQPIPRAKSSIMRVSQLRSRNLLLLRRISSPKDYLR
jgi:hypothetical protein